MLALWVPTRASTPGAQLFLTAASGEVSVSSWPSSPFLLCDALLWHFSGWLVCARRK